MLKKFAGEAVIYGIGSVLPKVLQFAMTPWLTYRVFSTGEYGDMNIMYAFAAFLLIIFTYGMETTLFRFGSEKGQKDIVFSTAAISLLISTLIFVSILFVFSDSIAGFLEQPNGGKFVQLFALITAFDSLAALFFARLRLENRPKRFAFFKILNVVFFILLILFFIEICPILIENGNSFFEKIYSNDSHLDLYFWSNVGASALVFLLLAKDFFKFEWKFDFTLWKRMMLYAMPLILVGMSGVINRQLDRIFLAKWLPDPETASSLTGIYGAGVKVAVLMSLFITAFNYAAEPFFFRNANRDDAKPIYAKIAHAFSIVGSVAFLGIVLYIDLVQILIGKDFRDGLVVVPYLLLAYFALGLFYNFSIWYKLKDKTHIGAWIAIAGAIITIGINYFFIPKIGIMAPAYAGLICYFFMAATSYIIGKKHYPIDYPIGKMLTYILIAVGIYALSEWIRPQLGGDVWKTLGVNTLLMFTFLGGIYFSKPFSKEELTL